MTTSDRWPAVMAEFLAGRIDRRTLMRRSAALGVSTMAVMAALRGIPVSAQAAAPQPTGPRPDGPPAPDDQQVLRMVTSSPYRMDPLTYGGDLWQMQMLVFQALTRVDADGTLVGGVADTWQGSSDGTSWTFQLNPNAMFSDGTPITAADVKWTWEWLANPKSQSVSPDVAAGRVNGYQAVRDGASETLEGIVADGDQTVTFNLSAPTPAFPAIAGSYNAVVLKRDNVLEGSVEWWRAPITSGFFKVTEFTPGDQATMTLERNEHWWREPAKLSRVTMELVADPQTQLVMYDNGEIDGMVCQPAEFAQATKPGGPRGADLYWDTAIATWYFGFFQEKPPFDDLKVRQAFAHALDLNAISIAGLSGIYPPQKRNIPVGFPCGGEEQWQPTFDPALAKQLLSESSAGGVEGLPPITIVISEQGGATALGTWGKVATVIQQQLQQNLGVNVELVRQVFESAPQQIEYLRALEGGAIFRLSYGATVQDPSFISSVALSTSSANYSAYTNPAVDDLINQADAELDADIRCELYMQVDKIISEEALFLTPFRGTSTWFFRPPVRGMSIVLGRPWNALHKIYIATGA